MSGNILIVDSVATNRIVMKVKLSAAFYRVTQASTAADAMAKIRENRPDAVLMSSELPDTDAAQFIRMIKAVSGGDVIPVIALVDHSTTDKRLELLRAGAADVVTKPFFEPVLLARLRSLARQSHSRDDLNLQSATAEALGFAEAPMQFTARGQVAALDPGTPQLQALCRTVAQRSAHEFTFFHIARNGGVTGLTCSPDVMLVRVSDAPDDPSLAHLAELRTAPDTRQARLVALLDSPDSPLAATVLDMGAHDIVGARTDPREIELRLTAQLRRKQAEDALRSRLHSGLQAAVTDPLTGLYNRRYALARMARLVSEADETGRGFVVMVADLDHFKAVNDTYGHTAGDIVLTRVATQLRAALRSEDMVARIGGEEFLILMPNAGRSTAQDMAQRLCRLVRETEIAVPGQAAAIHVTISLGATVAKPSGPDTRLSIESLLNQADRALYGSKSDGRDTVTVTRLSAA